MSPSVQIGVKRVSATMIEATISVAMLGAFLWALRYLIPKAVKDDDVLAIVSAVGIAVLALLAWLLIGEKVVSR